ncbi:hypothetical protein [Microbispora rosea]
MFERTLQLSCLQFPTNDMTRRPDVDESPCHQLPHGLLRGTSLKRYGLVLLTVTHSLMEVVAVAVPFTLFNAGGILAGVIMPVIPTPEIDVTAWLASKPRDSVCPPP